VGVVHIATGNLLRDAVQRRTSVGLMAQAFLNRGELVPDEIINRLVSERLDGLDTRGGAVFDGYPRTLAQATGLDRELRRRGGRLMLAAAIEISADVLVRRLSSRRVCLPCGATYNVISNPPREPDQCDACGEPLVCRSDDSPAVIRRRLDVYRREAGPLEDHYTKSGHLAVIDGDNPLDTVTAMLLAAVRGAQQAVSGQWSVVSGRGGS
jgi:adenylate kinase